MKKSEKPMREHIDGFFEYADLEKGLGTKTQETYSRLLHQFSNWLNITINVF